MISFLSSFFAPTFADSNSTYRYRVRKKQSLGTILNRLGACPLWGKNGNVEYIARLNSENIKDPSSIEVGLVIEIPKNILVYEPHPFFLELANNEIIENPKFLKEAPCRKRYAVARNRAPSLPIGVLVNPGGETVRAEKDALKQAELATLKAQAEFEIQRKIAADLEQKKQLAQAHATRRIELQQKKYELELAREREKTRALELKKELELEKERQRLEALEQKTKIEEAKALVRAKTLEKQKQLEVKIEHTRRLAQDRAKEMELNKDLERHARAEETRLQEEAELLRREQQRVEAERLAQEAARKAQQIAERKAEEEARQKEALLVKEKAAREEAALRAQEKMLEEQKAAALEKEREEKARQERERAEIERVAQEAAKKEKADLARKAEEAALLRAEEERKEFEAARKQADAERIEQDARIEKENAAYAAAAATEDVRLAALKKNLTGNDRPEKESIRTLQEDLGDAALERSLPELDPLAAAVSPQDEAPQIIPPRARNFARSTAPLRSKKRTRAPAKLDEQPDSENFNSYIANRVESDTQPNRIPARQRRRAPAIVPLTDKETILPFKPIKNRQPIDAEESGKTTQSSSTRTHERIRHTNNIDKTGEEIERATASLNTPDENQSTTSVKKDTPPIASIDDTLNFSILPNFGLINGVDLATGGTASLASELEYKFQLSWKVKGWARDWFYEGTFETQQRKFIQPVDITITQAIAQYSRLHLVVGNNITNFLGLNASFGAEQLPSFITENTGDIRLDRVFMPQMGLGVELRPFRFDNINAGIRAQYLYHGPTMGFDRIHQGGNTQTYTVWVERYYDTIGLLGRIAYTRAKYQGDYANHDLLDVNAGIGISVRLEKLE